jgi:hypothetical protein
VRATRLISHSVQAMLERQDSLDEALLSTCFAYIKKASDDGLDGLVTVLQTILQLYAAQALAQAGGGGGGDAAGASSSAAEDVLVTDICAAGVGHWETMIEDLASAGALLHAAHWLC